MTQEEKHTLLVDLCARLPYGVIIQEYNEEYGYADNSLNTIGIGYFSIHEACVEGTWINHIENVKPYLRPMSSMTSEEWCEYLDASLEDEKSWVMAGEKARYKFVSVNNREDYLNSHHFDYRGLIERGLALEAPKDMYNTKTE